MGGLFYGYILGLSLLCSTRVHYEIQVKTPVPELLGPVLVLLDSCMHDSIVLFQRPRDKMHLVEVRIHSIILL